MDTREASRTAVLVCQGRAAAHGRVAPDRFADPTAFTLLRDAERVPVEQVRAGEVPRGFGDRMAYEMVRACAEVMVPRTVAIDDAVRAHLTPQLVILGAGLDGRAWRMPELATVDVFEVDHPASQLDKQDRLGLLESRRARPMRFVPLDFTRDAVAAALAHAGHRDSVPTTWIWEGVVPYLTKSEVSATVDVIAGRSAPGSRLVVNYQTPSAIAAVGRLAMRAVALAARRADPLAHESRRSSWKPAAMRELLGAHGLAVIRDDDLRTLAEGLRLQVAQGRSLSSGRVAVADR